MYSYYLLSSWHFNVWWKKYLTLFQILQFVVDLTVCMYCSLQLDGVLKKCEGKRLAGEKGVGIIGYYFFLFVKVYIRSYKKKEKSE